MSYTTTLKDFGKAADILKIGLDLEEITHKSIYADFIRATLKQPGKLKQLVQEIYEQSLDNREMIAGIISEETLSKIEKLFNHS